jgi:hypothetical protein
MTQPERPTGDEVESLVRAHLAREAEGVSGSDMLARVRSARRPQPAPRRRWARALSAVAAILLAFLGGLLLSPGPARASAETLVREAKKVHAGPRDRQYLVQIEPEPGGVLERFPWLNRSREHRLWTRGDRFRIESAVPERKWAWGRDEQGRVWIALGVKQGFRFEREEARESVGLLCDALGMQTETLLDDVLRNFDLTRDDADDTATLRVVRATPRTAQARNRLLGATLEIDAETKVLQRLIVHRAYHGQPMATVTFTLIETGQQLDASYTLEGHLDAGAALYEGMLDETRRARLLRALFGLPGK